MLQEPNLTAFVTTRNSAFSAFAKAGTSSNHIKWLKHVDHSAQNLSIVRMLEHRGQTFLSYKTSFMPNPLVLDLVTASLSITAAGESRKR